MNAWSKNPFVRILIPFIIGLLVYRSNWIPALSAGLMLSVSTAMVVVLAAWFFLFDRWQTYRNRHVQGALLITVILLLGWLLAFNHDDRTRPDFMGNINRNEPVEMILTIDNTVEQKSNSLKTTAVVHAYKQGDAWIKCHGKLLLYISNNDTVQPLHYGDRIVASFRLNEVQEPLLNSDFDYKSYLADKNIFYQAYIADEQYAILERNCGNWFIQQSLVIRDRMVSILQSQLGDSDEFGVVSAMLIGYRADISADMMKAYSEAGVIHIMSVSGLHVGVIYIMITAFIGLFGWFRKNKWLNILIVLLLIWFYALLTGLSASVLRSAVMISFVAFGQAMQRSISPYNSLASAAFLLLVFNPGSIGEIGFQLSFVAVLGILLFQRPIYNTWHIRNKWLDKIWQLACVSLAAQLITLPFILYYFGQFPVYFLVSNIIVVPLSSLVLYAGMAAVFLSWIPWLNVAAAFITLWLTKIMNWVVITIESWPSAVISNIYLSSWAAIIVMLIIFSVYLLYQKKNFRLIYAVLTLCIVATLFQWNKNYSNCQQQQTFILKDGRNYVVAIQEKNTMYTFVPADSSQPSAYVQQRLDKFASRNHLQTIRVPLQYSDNVLYRHQGFIGWNQFRVLIWTNYKMPQNTGALPKLDLMLAPALSKYYFEKHQGPLPAKNMLTKVYSDKAGILNLNSKKEWSFSLN